MLQTTVDRQRNSKYGHNLYPFKSTVCSAIILGPFESKKTHEDQNMSFGRQRTGKKEMYKVAFQLQAAAASANNKAEHFTRDTVHPQTNKRLVGACKALVILD
jgi:hypothetical protein